MPGLVEDRARHVAQLLRQLAVGLSAYRLYPGDLAQPGFVAATRRIDGAAHLVLLDGPFDGEVTSTTFVTLDGPVAPDEAIERLATACYERRVERIRIRAAPTREDLAAFYAVLTESLESVVEGGGADAMLGRSGVASIALGEMNPEAVGSTAQGREPVVPAAGIPVLADIRIPDEDLALLRAVPREMAESLLDRLHFVVGELPPEMRSSLDMYRMLRERVEALPEEQRVLLHAILLDRVLDDPIAERYIGTMSDTELAELLVEVGEHFERDPGELASRLVAKRLRSDDLEALVRTVAEEGADNGRAAGTSAGDPEQADPTRASMSETADERSVYETVGELLGQTLVAREQEDLAGLRAEFPAGVAEQRAVAAAAVCDYLIAEQDLERLERVLGSWMSTARDALREADLEAIRTAVAVLERPRAESAAHPERSILFDVYRNQTPAPELLRELVQQAEDAPAQRGVSELLAPFGAAPVISSLELLGDDLESQERSVVLAVATELARGHLDVLARRLMDPNIDVARSAVILAYRSNDVAAMPVLDSASAHPAPEVRAEAARGLIAVAGAAGVGRLQALTRDSDERIRTLAVVGLGGLVGPEAIDALVEVAGSPGDVATRKGAIEQLALHPSDPSRERLKALVSGRGAPRLPRQLRRYAKRRMKR